MFNMFPRPPLLITEIILKITFKMLIRVGIIRLFMSISLVMPQEVTIYQPGPSLGVGTMVKGICLTPN